MPVLVTVKTQSTTRFTPTHLSSSCFLVNKYIFWWLLVSSLIHFAFDRPANPHPAGSASASALDLPWEDVKADKISIHSCSRSDNSKRVVQLLTATKVHDGSLYNS